MKKYFVNRLIQMVIVLVGISLISFFIMHLAPGDPINILAERNATPEQKEHIRELYGLNEPVWKQYLIWVSKLLRGDFGTSYVTGRPVTEMIFERLPATLMLNFWAMIVIYVIAIPAGMISALRQYSFFDHLVTTLTFFGRALPQFWFALLLIYFVGMKVPGIQISGMATYGIEFATHPFWVVLKDRLSYIILPLIVLAFSGMAGITRYMRAGMLDVIYQDYMRTARAKGLSERQIIMNHGFRNAILPIVTLLGFELPILFSGAVIVESIFSWPGIGLLAINSIYRQDYMVVMAFNIMGAVMTIVGMLISDILYLIVDPRIKLK